MPLRPSEPGFPGGPWGPTGPVFPWGPSKPGSPFYNKTATGCTQISCFLLIYWLFLQDRHTMGTGNLHLLDLLPWLPFLLVFPRVLQVQGGPIWGKRRWQRLILWNILDRAFWHIEIDNTFKWQEQGRRRQHLLSFLVVLRDQTLRWVQGNPSLNFSEI